MLGMPNELESEIHADALRLLNAEAIPYVVAGAYALRHYTGVVRFTKDLDLFLTPREVPRALAILRQGGFRTRVLARHWLSNAKRGGYVVDLIYGFGGWRGSVDNAWLAHSSPGSLHGVPVRFAPLEETVWMKAYVAHRERFDGADVLHLLRAGRGRFNWQRFVALFDDAPELLLAYLMLFQFVYPNDRETVPDWVLDTLIERELESRETAASASRVTRGTLIDRFSYLADVALWGYRDGREAYAVAQGYRPGDLSTDREEALHMVAEGKVRPARIA
jgi:hypothetical protein